MITWTSLCQYIFNTILTSHSPGFDHFLGRLGIFEQLPARVGAVARLHELHRDVVDDLLVHGVRHLGQALARQHAVWAFVQRPPLQQPAVEGSRWCVYTCKDHI